MALAAAIDQNQTTALAVMEASLAAVSEREAFGAVVQFDKELALAGAAAADETPRDQRGPFHGVPFLMKDLGGPAKGLPVAAGSVAVRRRASKPGADSHFAAALKAAGLLPYGVTATPPFGLSLTCEPEGGLPARNPWDHRLTPGGSSGGAAAAVAAGIVAIAHATDAAGSIRVPAACCGLTGLKPSRGAVLAGPEFGNHLMGLASELVLARSVRDVETAFGAVNILSLGSPMPDHPTIGLALSDRHGKSQIRAAQMAAAALRDAGCHVRDIEPLDEVGLASHGVARTILAVSLAEWVTALDVSDDDLPPLAAAMAQEGRDCPATTLFAVNREMAFLTYKAAMLFANVDAILMPTLSDLPLPVGTLDLSGSDPTKHMAELEAFAPNAAIANVAGLPALALPFGDENRIPVGVQLLGPHGSDLGLLALGAMIEDRAPALDFPFPIAGLPE